MSESSVSGKGRLGGEFISERLRADGIGVAVVRKCAGRVVGQGVGVNDARRAVDDHGDHSTIVLVVQFVRVEVVGRPRLSESRHKLQKVSEINRTASVQIKLRIVFRSWLTKHPCEH